jgi:hypothetical protein
MITVYTPVLSSARRVADRPIISPSKGKPPNMTLKLTATSLPSVARMAAAERHDRWTDLLGCDEVDSGEIASIAARIPGEDAEIRDCRVGADIEVWQG